MVQAAKAGRNMAPLILGAIGVVFGDIGTSPLYALRVAFSGPHGLSATPDNVHGLLSMLFWALIIIVTLKYVLLIMRADNRGEGGILALTALVSHGLDPRGRIRWWLVGFGIFGSAMFYGDGMITPAVSVLGAVEGLEVLSPLLHPFIVPISLAILIGLFWIQRHGTASVGAFFGPVCLAWFVALGALGAHQIAREPGILAALLPSHAIHFTLAHPLATFFSLGAVVLAVTGTEALYADMGHFGIKPIRRAWFIVVLPALALNYFGQGALLLADPTAVRNPFYLMAPQWAVLPLIILATMAAVIASQAVISGAFSLTRQAIQMGYCPRLKILHTSDREIGQIYVPFINWTLFVAVTLLVLGFRNSDNLAAAYGIAVTMAMLIDSVLIYVVMRRVWRWRRPVAMLIVIPLLAIDVALLSANVIKIPDGGWFPLLIGAVVFTLLTTWKKGRMLLMERLNEDSMPLDVFIDSIGTSPPPRVPGTAVFLTSTADRVPHALLHNLKHNKVLHDRVVFLTVVTRDIPRVPPAERVRTRELGCQFWQMEAYYGFTEDPDVPALLEAPGRDTLQFDMMDTSFFVSRETLIATVRHGMALWRERLFVAMSKMAVKASDFFRVPTNRVVELGTQVEL
ncbi:MAG: potassium transporter Kup [Betaproteobacteria bacterium]|nr:potassium transporter Kup [Betaproteobacteria bacterium]